MENIIEKKYDKFRGETSYMFAPNIQLNLNSLEGEIAELAYLIFNWSVSGKSCENVAISLSPIFKQKQNLLKEKKIWMILDDESQSVAAITENVDETSEINVFPLSLEQMKKICFLPIEKIDFRFESSIGDIDFKKESIVLLQLAARAIYNASIDNTQFTDAYEKLVEIISSTKIESELQETQNQWGYTIQIKSNDYVDIEHDKFENKTTVRLEEQIKFEWESNTLELLEREIGLRFLLFDDSRSYFVLDFEATSDTSSPHGLCNGELILLINNEKISLQPHENFSQPYLSKYYKESAFYYLTKEILDKICHAEVVDIRVTNGSDHCDLVSDDKLQWATQLMVSSCFATDEYPNAVKGYDYWKGQIVIAEEKAAEEAELARRQQEAEERRRREMEWYAKEAEEAQIRREKRQQWWKENHKKFFITIGYILIAIILLIGITKIIQIRNIAKANQLAITEIEKGEMYAKDYDFDQADVYYRLALRSATNPKIITSINTHQQELQEQIKKAEEEYQDNLKRLKILLEADDYQFNDYSNQCLDKMIQIAPQRKETIYYRNMRGK